MNIARDYPKVWARMEADRKLQLFNGTWTVHGPESRRYISGLLGREVQGNELIENTLQEIEDRL